MGVRRIAAGAVCAAALLAAFVTYRAIHRIRLRGPLIAAIKAHDRSRVRELLNAGADPNARDTPPRSMSLQDIWHAITHSKESPGATAATALQLAAVDQEDDIARMLIEHGAYVNAKSSYWPDPYTIREVITFPSGTTEDATPTGYTALMDSCGNRDVPLTKLLLEHGADPNPMPPDSGDTPLMLAILGHEFATMLTLGPDAGHEDPIVRMLLARGARVEGSATVVAAMNNSWPSVLPLLQHGADVNAKSDDPLGRTLAIEAAAQNDEAVITSLAEHHANLSATDSHKRTALMELCHRYMQELSIPALKTLLEHGADPNLQDDQGITALMEAAGVGKPDSFTIGPNLEAIQLLLNHGTNVRAKDRSGKTVLDKLKKPSSSGDEYAQKVYAILAAAAKRPDL